MEVSLACEHHSTAGKNDLANPRCFITRCYN